MPHVRQTVSRSDSLSNILNQIATIIQEIILALGYPGIALIMFTENIFPPIPSELVMPFAGFLVGNPDSPSAFTFVGVVASGTVGAVVGAVVLYYIGVWADEPVARAFLRRYGRWFLLSEEDLDRALSFFKRYGEIIVFFGRLIPIIRSLISIPAGMNRMSLLRFLLFTTLGATLWNVALTGAGVILGANWEQVLDIIDTYQNLTLVVLGAAVVLFVVVRLWQRRRKASVVTEE
jgi:membrane protein DedA with SNARE-associated domain